MPAINPYTWSGRKALLLIAVGTLASGCVTYHTRYFARTEHSDIRLEDYHLAARIVAYQSEKAHFATLNKLPFNVSIRVEQGDAERESRDWRQDRARVDSLAEAFLDRMATAFKVDSLVLHQTLATNTRIHLVPDTSSYSPRHGSFLTLRFGQVKIPRETSHLRAVLHVSKPGGSISMPDSVVWLLEKVETMEEGLLLARDKVRGYE